jgi:DnaJ-class molecular chaperone
MPHLTTNVGDIPCTDEQYARFLEKCHRCEGSGFYNYFPHENRFKILFLRLIGALKCLTCHGTGKVLTEEGKEFVARADSDARWKALQEAHENDPRSEFELSLRNAREQREQEK